MAWSDTLSAGAVFVYPNTVDGAMPAITDYVVVVNGDASPVYGAKIGLDHSYIPLPATINSEVVGFTAFDMNGAVTAVVTVDVSRTVTSARVVPTSYGCTPSVVGQVITIPISRYGQYELQLNGSESKPLYIFANPVDTNIPAPTDPGVTYYAAGVYNVGAISLVAGDTLYLEPGAIVHGWVNGTGDNITVRGRGILDGSAIATHDQFICFMQSGNNIKYEGFIITDSPNWTVRSEWCTNVLVDNVKLFGYRQNSDGVDIQSCSAVEVRNSFIRTWDDGIVVKGTDSGDVYDISVHDNVCCGDLGEGALKIGTETRASQFYNITFENNDIVHAHQFGAITIQNDHPCNVHDITYRNIRIQDHHGTNGTQTWILMQIGQSSNGDGWITDITLENISVIGNVWPIRIKGAPGGHVVSGVYFTNLTHEGTSITTFAEAHIQANAYIENIYFDGILSFDLSRLFHIPVVQTSGVPDHKAGNATLVPEYPTNRNAGDLFILQLGHGNSGSQLTTVYTFPVGWTQIYLDQVANMRQFLMTKVSDGTEAGAISITVNPGQVATTHTAIIHLISGSDNVTLEGPAVLTGGGTSVGDVGVTTTSANRVAFNFGLHAVSSDAVSFAGETGGDWTLRADAVAGQPTHVWMQAADMEGAGTINFGTFSLASGSWVNRGFALIPAPTASRPAVANIRRMFEA